MEEIGAKGVERSTTKNSVRDLVLNVFGNKFEPLHLFSSAVLNVTGATHLISRRHMAFTNGGI
jgi:hypothetical protein